MERKYRIYKITSPSNKSYIGLTIQSLIVRWQCHIKKAKTNYNHPFYNALRKYGAVNFKTEVLHNNLTKTEAENLEQKEIALIPKKLSYNISIGGESDGFTGAKIFWDLMKSNPDERKKYVEKLSKIKRENDWTDYKDLTEKNLKWRKDNAKIAYKLSYRALRIATRNKPKKAEDTRSLKEKLLWKHRRDLATKSTVTQVWVNRNEEEKKKIGFAISETHKKRWAALKADPEKYKAYLEKRNNAKFLIDENNKRHYKNLRHYKRREK